MNRNDDSDISLAVRAFKIGDKVRDLRLKNRLTLQDLAGRTGLSKPFLSQIENGRVIPPVPTLLRLARALEVGMGYFFEDESNGSKISITRKSDRVRIEKRPHHEKGAVNYVYMALESKMPNKNMQPFLVEFPSHESNDVVFMSHPGEEFLYVTEGVLEFRTVDRVEILEAGDSIYMESDLSHTFRTVGDSSSKAIAVMWSKHES